jgi:hypothetical protein
MKYSILIYDSPEGRTQMQGPKAGEFFAQWPPFLKIMQDAGIYIAGAGLQSADTATTLRFDNDKRLVQDGPYADTKEQLGGFYMIDVPDLDAALEWAARTPRLPGQVIEVRPNLVVPGN